jgi:diguanylate cyclase (GGDEF)-like protein
VSRNHAELKIDAGRLTIEDLGSTNGTIVNDEHIEEPLRLRNGDLIKIGRTIFKFIASNNIEAAYHDEIYRMTTVDGLTQVFNRRYFEDAIERELSRSRRYSRPLSLVLIDIDHFKKINDTWGHLAGDAVLKDVARTVRTRTRREDVLARYGGEEFALLLPEIDLKGASLLAEKVRKLVEKHTFTFDGEDIDVTLSAGVATVQKKGEDAHELIRKADEKLYEAKSAGRNRVVH